MLIHKLVPLLALALNVLLLGSALIGDRRHSRRHVFALVALALAVWNLGVFGLRASEDPETALHWEFVVHVGVIAVPAFFYHYVLAFLELPARGPALWSAYLLGAGFLVVSPTPLFMPGVVETAWGYAPRTGPLYPAFFVYFQTFLVLGLVQLVLAYRRMVSSFRRNRTSLVIAGVCTSLLGGAVDFLRFILGWERLYPLGIPTNALFAIALGVAVVRYRLWNVNVLGKRILLYVLTSLALVPLLVAAFHMGSWTAVDLAANLPLVIALTVVAVSAALPGLRRLEERFERLMFRSEHGVRDALAALSQEMASVLDLERLGRTLTGRLVERVPVVHATLYARAPESDAHVRAAQAVSRAAEATPPAALDAHLVLWLKLTGGALTLEELSQQALADERLLPVFAELEAARVALIVPLFMEGEIVAVLAVGEKVAGDVFDAHEVALLEALVGQTAIAFRNARLYDDLRRQMDELRTTQQQLVQSAKLAAIGELAASVAHELNSPLTVILGRTGLLIRQHHADAAAAGAHVSKIESEALRASRITRRLLDFARRREPIYEPVHLNTLVPRALDLLEAKLAGRGIAVETVLAPGLPPVQGDADELTQVLLNLTGNAIDAMAGGGSLVIETGVELEGSGIRLRVMDTGQGIPADRVGRIFEPFYTTKEEGKGTGLGLAISLGIVKNHAGTIEVDSVPGRGTTMTVRLPAARVGARRLEATV